jgi:uncharacterized protein YggU (UPF0235/DUF167 family)
MIELTEHAQGTVLAVQAQPGETSRQKRFLVIGVTPDDLRRRLAAAMPDDGPTLPLS